MYFTFSSLSSKQVMFPSTGAVCPENCDLIYLINNWKLTAARCSLTVEQWTLIITADSNRHSDEDLIIQHNVRQRWSLTKWNTL